MTTNKTRGILSTTTGERPSFLFPRSAFTIIKSCEKASGLNWLNVHELGISIIPGLLLLHCELLKSSIFIAVGLIEVQIRTDVWIFSSLTNSEQNKNDSKSALSRDLCLLGVARKSFGRLGTICLGIHLEMSPKFHTDYSLLSFLSLKTTSSQLQRQMFEKDVKGHHVLLSSCK